MPFVPLLEWSFLHKVPQSLLLLDEVGYLLLSLRCQGIVEIGVMTAPQHTVKTTCCSRSENILQRELQLPHVESGPALEARCT